MAEEIGLAAVVDMNVLPGLDRFGGFADGDAILDNRLPLGNFLASYFMAKRNRLPEYQAVARDLNIGLKVQQCADVVIGMNGEADAAHVEFCVIEIFGQAWTELYGKTLSFKVLTIVT